MSVIQACFYVFFIYFLAEGHNSNAEIIRKLQKAALQPLFLSTESVDQEPYITGQFLVPPDTQAKFDGGELISFQNDIMREGRKEWEAKIKSRFSDYNTWLTLQSNSTRETLTVRLNYKFANRSQPLFIENSCETQIEKAETGYHTEYKAMTRNCGATNIIRESFSVGLKFNKTMKTENIVTRYPGEASIEKYLKYIDTYKVHNNDIFYALIKWPAMKKDEVTLESLSFELWVNERDAISGIRVWRFDIV